MKNMNIKILIPSCVGIFLLLLFSCKNEEKKAEATCSADVKVSPINPNGDSELALLMRKMYADADSIKKLITNNEGNSTKEYIDELERIHTAIPTDKKVKTPEFEAYTKLMVNEANALFSNEANKAEGFNSLVNRCIDCHKSFCPGPIDKIKKLSLPNPSEGGA